MLTKAFWKATAERSVRTFAQVLVGSLGLDTLGIINAKWSEGLALGVGAAVLTVLTAVATSGGPEGPGLTETVSRR
ncbi:holin [Streptomyces sp. NPDC050211]|uniref:holin n=1 Tax=Streptomyces sp. NPDC050211 TaxID=3154932 RepID=UPI00344148FD